METVRARNANRSAGRSGSQEKARLERKALAGKLIDADEIKRVGFEAGKQIKEHCLAIPDRCAPLVAATSDAHECKMVLVKEITYILENLSNALAIIK